MIRGNYTFQTGHSSTTAYLAIGYTKIDFQNETALIRCCIYKSENAMNNEAKPEPYDFALLPESQEEDEYTIPAFADVFGIDKLQEENYNCVLGVYELIKTMPQFSDFE